MSFLQKWRTGRKNRLYQWMGEDKRKGFRRVNVVEIYVLMYINGKI
jgi:hypothetical protein